MTLKITIIVLLFYNQFCQVYLVKREDPYEGEEETIQCPARFKYNYYGNHCFLVNASYIVPSWRRANEICQTYFSDPLGQTGLMTVDNMKTKERFEQEKGKGTHFVWVGFRKYLENHKIVFRWITTNRLLTADIFSLRGLWQQGEPNSGMSEACGDYLRTGLNDVQCVKGSRGISCEIANVDPCQTNNGGCSQICISGFRRRSCFCKPGFQLAYDSDTLCIETDWCKVNNGGCDHFCHQTVNYMTCSCRPGYRLVNERKCEDINECLINNGGCEHTCNNTFGTWLCTCPEDKVPRGKFCYDPIPEDKPVEAVSWQIYIMTASLHLIFGIVGGFLITRNYDKRRRERYYKETDATATAATSSSITLTSESASGSSESAATREEESPMY